MHTIDGARASIKDVLVRLIDLRRTRTGSSLKAAVGKISGEVGINRRWLDRVREGVDASFAPHLHFYLRLCEALERENAEWDRRVEDNRKALGEVRNAGIKAVGGPVDKGRDIRLAQGRNRL